MMGWIASASAKVKSLPQRINLDVPLVRNLGFASQSVDELGKKETGSGLKTRWQAHSLLTYM